MDESKIGGPKIASFSIQKLLIHSTHWYSSKEKKITIVPHYYHMPKDCPTISKTSHFLKVQTNLRCSRSESFFFKCLRLFIWMGKLSFIFIYKVTTSIFWYRVYSSKERTYMEGNVISLSSFYDISFSWLKFR